MNVKFSTLIKNLAEKQEATELFIEEQRRLAIVEAEARLAQLEERSQKLRESQGQIAALHNLSDTDLIRVCTSAFMSSLHKFSFCGVHAVLKSESSLRKRMDFFFCVS